MQKTVARRRGTLEARALADGRIAYTGRLRLRDGTKSPRMAAPAGMTQVQASAWLAGLQAAEDADHAVYLAKVERARAVAAGRGEACEGETCDAWFRRYVGGKECGAGHRRVSASVWKVWISPIIGSRPIASLGRDDLEDVRDHLDRAMAEGTTRASSAANVWSVLTSAMRAAYAGKDRGLRVHTTPISAGILPPRGGRARARPWLYPSEWAQLAACEAVPAEWRVLYAIALYTGLRPNELRSLTWSDVDLEARVLRVTKAWDPEARVVGPPKTPEAARTIPIRAPLADVLRPGAPHELVAPAHWRKVAERFRGHLRAAGVLRPRLYASNATEEQIDFRSLRDTFATWRALEGADPFALKRELGHRDLATSDAYVKAAAGYSTATLGAPFPACFGPPSGPPAPKRRRRMAPTVGLESTASTDVHEDSSTCHDGTPQTPHESVPLEGTSAQALAHPDAVLARALEAAAAAGRWGAVEQIARALAARRSGGEDAPGEAEGEEGSPDSGRRVVGPLSGRR